MSYEKMVWSSVEVLKVLKMDYHSFLGSDIKLRSHSCNENTMNTSSREGNVVDTH